ncbi:hypothetical protein LOC67_20495 [Stieleria sp. JC731]|uniref:hypothetical protein n=1 Tax=Pirellulaceae TaxID=2691357 RepID=UPI001E517E40|nr:hypothetical protein [Stieleria sp. JC731]MCC9602936.1 hypothetical protein [Stieleria sp. JC731]
MSNRRMTRRKEMRQQQAFPFGMLAGLLTAIAVTLIGVFLRLEAFTILTRATVSSLILGTVVSLGVGVIRLADSGYKTDRG